MTAQKQALHFPLQLRQGGIQRLAPRIDDNRPRWAQLVQLKADGLAHAPLDPVAHHGFAQRARHRKPDARPAPAGPRRQKAAKKGPANRLPLLYTRRKSWIAAGGHVLENRAAGHARKPLPLRTDSEFLAAAGAAARQHRPAVLGFHAAAEPVGLGAMAVIWLKCTFWHFSSMSQYISPETALLGWWRWFSCVPPPMVRAS